VLYATRGIWFWSIIGVNASDALLVVVVVVVYLLSRELTLGNYDFRC